MCTSYAPAFIRRLIDLGEGNQQPVLAMFLDWETAFDRVSHSALFSALRRFQLPEHFVQITRSLHNQPEFFVEADGIPSERYIQQTGIRQGCPLSPYLLLVAMTALPHDVYHRPNLIVKDPLPNTSSNEVLFADDTAIFASSSHSLQALLRIIEK